jgi:hypothetical protein
MSVYIACDKCEKRLKIPEEVVGHPIKCPVCGSVFKATPEKVAPEKAAAIAPVRLAPAAHEDEEDIVPIHKKPTILDDEDEDRPKPRKKAAAVDEDEEGIVTAARRPAAIDEDDEDRPARPRRRAADEDEAEEAEAEEAAKKGKRGTPWYVLGPLVLLSLCGVGLAGLWTIGFSYLDMDRGLKFLSDYDTKIWIGVSSAGVIILLCLIVSLIPMRAWLRFLLVFFFLAVGYGGSFAAIHWWNQLPLPNEKQPDPVQNPPANGPMGMPMGPGGGGRGAPMPPPPGGPGRGQKPPQ